MLRTSPLHGCALGHTYLPCMLRHRQHAPHPPASPALPRCCTPAIPNRALGPHPPCPAGLVSIFAPTLEDYKGASSRVLDLSGESVKVGVGVGGAQPDRRQLGAAGGAKPCL